MPIKEELKRYENTLFFSMSDTMEKAALLMTPVVASKWIEITGSEQSIAKEALALAKAVLEQANQ